MTTEIGVKLLHPNAKLPVRASEHASGLDLHACLPGGPVTLSQHPTIVPTGLALEVPPGLDAEIRPRSGLTTMGVICTLGTLDADYRGELLVVMYAFAPGIEYTIHDGDRIAQLVITRLEDVTLVQRDELSPTARGVGGHGSTGR